MSKPVIENTEILIKAQEELAETTRTLDTAFKSFYKAVEYISAASKSPKGQKINKSLDTAVDKVKRIESVYENVAKGLDGFLEGLNGIVKVSQDTIFKGTDINADYPALSQQYRDGMVKLADRLRPIFVELKRKLDGTDASSASANSNYSLTGSGMSLFGEESEAVQLPKYSLTDKEGEAGEASRYGLSGGGMGISSSIDVGDGTEFGAGQEQGGMGLGMGIFGAMGGLMGGAVGGAMGEDGEPTGIEGFRLQSQEFLEEKQGFFDTQLSMQRKYKGESDDLEKKSWNDKLSIASSSAGAMANLMQNLYVTTGSKHRALFEAMKAFSIAETIIETFKSAQLSYAAFAGIPIVGPALGIAAAAAAIAAGMARVNAIRKTKPGGATGSVSAGGRANPSFKGGSFNAYPPPQAPEEDKKPTQQITMNIYNPLSEQNWAEIAENNIIPALNDASERNINLTVKTVAA